MIDPVQELVDSLAYSLQRSVAVDDGDLNLVAYSPHFGDADTARLESLTGRRIAGAVLDYVLEVAPRTWRGPQRVAARPKIGILYPRLGVPLRYRHEFFGLMWVVEMRELSEDEVAQCVALAATLASLLARRARAHTEENDQTESLVLGLLSGRQQSEEAADDLLDLGVFAGCTHFDTIVLSLDAPRTGPTLDTDVVREVFDRVVAGRPPRSVGYAITATDSVLIVGSPVASTPERRGAIGEAVLRVLGTLAPEVADGARVGIGNPTTALTGVAVAFEQARSAARIARTGVETVVAWADHPVEALLSAVVRDDIELDLVPDLLTRLRIEDDRELSQLLRVFLDRAGNVQATSEQLHVHRTTVYYRLERFQKFAGIDLTDGRMRLMLHLWLTVQEQQRATNRG